MQVTASDCVHNYVTKMGDSCMWTRLVCFTGIWCGTKTGASFLCFFLFVLPISFPRGQLFFSAESQFHCCINLRFRGQFPCLVYTLQPLDWLQLSTSLIRHPGKGCRKLHSYEGLAPFCHVLPISSLLGNCATLEKKKRRRCRWCSFFQGLELFCHRIFRQQLKRRPAL